MRLRLRLLLAATLLGWVLPVPLSAQGVEFFEGNWQQTLDAARAQHKIVFVDAFTTWCGPCKAMVRNTFPNEEVGAFFNKEFINYSFDMEKGEGIEFARKYKVTAYPTLLWIDPDGKVVHTTLGYKAPLDLLKEGRLAARPENKQAIWESQYQSGNTSPEVLLQVMKTRKAQGGDYATVATQYFASLTEKQLSQPEAWEAIRVYGTRFDSREIQFLLKNRKAFVKDYGIGAVDGKLMEVAESEVKLKVKEIKDAEAEQVITQIQAAIPDKGKSVAWLRMVMAAEQDDMAAYYATASSYFTSFSITDALQLADAATRVVNWGAATAEQLEVASTWARQAAALSPNYANHLLRARLCKRLGQKTEAREAANIAVRLALQQKTDPAEAEALLDSL